MTTFITAQPMLARRQIRLAVVAALGTLPGVLVESPGDWATPPASLPAVLARVTRERKESWPTRTEPEFDTTVTMELEARVGANTAIEAQDAIESLCYAVENAVLLSYSAIGIAQRVTSVDTEVEITAEGRLHFGAAKMLFAFETAETFDPTKTAPDATTWPVSQPVTDSLLSFGIHLDMASPYDPNGVYVPSPDAPPYTPVPAPRTTGPDGRDEAALDIQLPQ